MDMYQCYSIDHMSFFLNVREMKVYIFFTIRFLREPRYLMGLSRLGVVYYTNISFQIGQ
jgi:hypothetical protein